MMRYILLFLFIIMLASRTLGLDLSLAPGLSVKNAILYMTGVLLFIESAVARNRQIELLPILIPFGLLVLYATLTWLAIILVLNYPHYDPFEALIALKGKLVDHFLILLIFFYGVVTFKDAFWLLKALIWVIIAGNVLTVVDALNIPDLGIITHRKDGRVEGLLGAANEFGAFLTFFLPATVALYWAELGMRRRLAMFGVLATILALILSVSRGAFVGTLVGGAAATFYLRHYISSRIIARSASAILIFLIIAVAALTATNFEDLINTRLSAGLDTGDQDTISSGRTSIWLGALREMLRFPWTFLTGFGWDAYYQSGEYRLATHSTYIDYLYNIGSIGLILFIITVHNSVAIARRAIAGATIEVRPHLLGFVFGMAGLVIAMVFNNLELPALYAWAFAGVALRLAIISMATEAGDLRRTSASYPRVVQTRKSIGGESQRGQFAR